VERRVEAKRGEAPDLLAVALVERKPRAKGTEVNKERRRGLC
jgi:hypothetical protein